MRSIRSYGMEVHWTIMTQASLEWDWPLDRRESGPQSPPTVSQSPRFVTTWPVAVCGSMWWEWVGHFWESTTSTKDNPLAYFILIKNNCQGVAGGQPLKIYFSFTLLSTFSPFLSSSNIARFRDYSVALLHTMFCCYSIILCVSDTVFPSKTHAWYQHQSEIRKTLSWCQGFAVDKV